MESDVARVQAVEEAVDEARHTFGQEIDFAALADALERRGWSFSC
jgi:hypothetical protein